MNLFKKGLLLVGGFIVLHIVINDCSYAQNKKIDTSKTVSGNILNEPNAYVKISTVIDKSTSGGKALKLITFNFDFKDLQTVNIAGLGEVPAKGEYTYLTSAQHLIFLNLTNDKKLASLFFENTVETMGSESVDLPQDSDFPQQFRSDTWAPDSTFTQNILNVIQKYFPSGVNAGQLGQINYYTTTYRNLPVKSSDIRAQVALKISQPFDPKSGKFTYRIQFVARDRPRLSDTWRSGNNVTSITTQAAGDFITMILDEINKLKPKK